MPRGFRHWVRSGGRVARTLTPGQITLIEHPAYQVTGPLGFRGTPTGIDATLVARPGMVPAVNTGIAGREPGVGQFGAGLVTPTDVRVDR